MPSVTAETSRQEGLPVIICLTCLFAEGKNGDQQGRFSKGVLCVCVVHHCAGGESRSYLCSIVVCASAGHDRGVTLTLQLKLNPDANPII